MHAGLIYGTAAMLDGLIDKISEEVGQASVVITGVYAKDILAFCRHDMTHDENLLLDGLYQVYMKNLQNKRNSKV